MSRSSRKLLINFISGFDAPGGVPLPERRRSTETAFEPPTDIYQTPDAIVVRIEIAGMSAEAIDLSIDETGGRLMVSGQRFEPAGEIPRRFYNLEIASGPFLRVVQLPRPIRVEGVAATYDNGFLVVSLPLRVEQSGETRNVPID